MLLLGASKGNNNLFLLFEGLQMSVKHLCAWYITQAQCLGLQLLVGGLLDLSPAGHFDLVLLPL